MDVNIALAMEDFLSHMGNFFIVIGFCAIITLCATGAFIYIVHCRGDDEFGDW